MVLNQGDPENGGQELLPLKSTDVDVQISGGIANVEIRQIYHNTGTSVLEAQYVFPGSTRAAVYGMTLKIDYQGPARASIRLDGSEPDPGNRDFILRYRLADDHVASGLLLHRDEKLGENFFLLTAQPPRRVRPEDIPPREYVFVVDVSGSMNGFPLNTAKALMRELIAGLTARDTFNVVLFAGSSQVFERASVPASPANVSRAAHWIESACPGTFLAKNRGRQFLVEEKISSGDQSWDEVSAWFWAAAFRRSTGPWWALTAIQPTSQLDR